MSLKMLKRGAALGLFALFGVFSAAGAADKMLGAEDPGRTPYFEAFAGKKVVYVPISMQIDLTAGWWKYMKENLDGLGLDLSVRDYNWDTGVGTQLLTALIHEDPKPDVLVVHNPDVQSFSQILKRAEKEGIYVIQVNMRANYATDAFVGADYNEFGEVMAERLVEWCSPENGGNGKVAIIQGVPTSGTSLYHMWGFSKVLNEHPEIELVANQAANWDASKAKTLSSTIIEQHPDICAIAGHWDGMDVGIAAAVKESGKPIKVITQSGGHQVACDYVRDGKFTEELIYSAQSQGQDIAAMVKYLLQSNLKPGSQKVTLFTPLKHLTKDNVDDYSCWTAKKGTRD